MGQAILYDEENYMVTAWCGYIAPFKRAGCTHRALRLCPHDISIRRPTTGAAGNGPRRGSARSLEEGGSDCEAEFQICLFKVAAHDYSSRAIGRPGDPHAPARSLTSRRSTMSIPLPLRQPLGVHVDLCLFGVEDLSLYTA